MVTDTSGQSKTYDVQNSKRVAVRAVAEEIFVHHKQITV